MCPLHTNPPLDIQPNQFFHTMDILIGIQNMDIKCPSSKIHQVPQIDRNILGLPNLQDHFLRKGLRDPAVFVYIFKINGSIEDRLRINVPVHWRPSDRKA